MDERQQNVTVGAGLQESRLNTELIDFLGKYWHYPVFIAAIIAGVYLGLGWLEREREKKVDAGFDAINAALTDPQRAGDPDLVIDAAAEHRGKASVWEVGTLNGIDILLESARLGISPTASTTAFFAPQPGDLITEEQARASVERARTLAKEVLDATKGKSNKDFFALKARWSLASAELGLGNRDEAIAAMKAYKEQAQSMGLTDRVEAADARLDLIARSASAHALLPKAELPTENQAPVATSNPGLGAPTGLPPGFAEQLRAQGIDPSTVRFESESTPLPIADGPVVPDAPDDTTPAPEGDAPEPAPAEDPEAEAPSGG